MMGYEDTCLHILLLCVFIGMLDAQQIKTLGELLEKLQELKENLREQAETRPSIGRVRIEGRSELHSELQDLNTDNDLLAPLREDENDRSDAVWIESITVATRAMVDISQRRTVDDFVGDFLKAADKLRSDSDSDAIRSLLYDRKESPKIAQAIAEFSSQELQEMLDTAEQLGLDALLQDED